MYSNIVLAVRALITDRMSSYWGANYSREIITLTFPCSPFSATTLQGCAVMQVHHSGYLPGDCGLHSHGTQGHTPLLSSLYSVCFLHWENNSGELKGPDAYGNMTPLEYYRSEQFQSQIIEETITEFPFFF